MDMRIDIYNVNPEMADKIFSKIDVFNQGRRQDTGYYALSTATDFRTYYALWRIFPDSVVPPLFIRTLALTFEDAAARSFEYLRNCNVALKVLDNRWFEPYYGLSDDVVSFGKYRGKRLAEIYYVDPRYVLWLANKCELQGKKYEKLIVLAKGFARVYFETTVPKKNLPVASRPIGEIGEKLDGLELTVLAVRLQPDRYKKDFYVDQNVLAVDADGNRFSFVLKGAAPSLNPYVLSCYSRAVHLQEVIRVASAKVLSHYQSKGVNYTRIGYVKMK